MKIVLASAGQGETTMQQKPSAEAGCGVRTERTLGASRMRSLARVGVRFLLGGAAALPTVGCGAMMQKINPPASESAPVISPYAQGAAAEHERDAAEARKARDAKKAEEDGKAAEKERKKAAESAEAEQACVDSRADRIADFKAQISKFQAEFRSHKPYGHWVIEHCQYEDTRAIQSSVKRTKDGVVSQTKAVGAESEFTCKGTRPAGLTLDLAERVLEIASQISSPSKPGVDRGQFEAVDRRCAASDEKAGVTLFVAVADIDGQKAILAK